MSEREEGDTEGMGEGEEREEGNPDEDDIFWAQLTQS